jgi:transcription elongation factor Elf1
MAKLEPSPFTCPNCAAEYRVVRVTVDPALPDREITCRSCGALLQGREGGFVLKYFMVSRPEAQALRRRRG